MAATARPVRVPFLDLKAQYHSIKPEIDAADRERSSRRSQFVLGEEVAGFEREFAAYSGAAHGIAVNSGHERPPPRLPRGRHRARATR